MIHNEPIVEELQEFLEHMSCGIAHYIVLLGNYFPDLQALGWLIFANMQLQTFLFILLHLCEIKLLLRLEHMVF